VIDGTRVKKFFRTPKGLLLAILSALTAIAAPGEGAGAAYGLLGAIAGAAMLDGVALRIRHRRWEFPDGAILSAMLVAMVLSAQGVWWHTALIAGVAILSKYAFRSRAANVFNPAAFAIVSTFYLFETGQSWWGALPNVPIALQASMVAGGLFITDRVNKMPLVLAFLGTFYGLCTALAFVGDPGRVAEVYRSPDVQAVLFFALFILTDPPTSPVKYPDQVVCGVLVAAVAFTVFMWLGVVYYLLAGVLVGNVWEAWRRVSRRAGHTFPHGIGAFALELSPWRGR